MTGFSALFALIAFTAMAATVAVLVAGISTLAAPESFRARYTNALMRWRVGLQAMAVVMLAFSMMAAGTT